MVRTKTHLARSCVRVSAFEKYRNASAERSARDTERQTSERCESKINIKSKGIMQLFAKCTSFNCVRRAQFRSTRRKCFWEVKKIDAEILG